MAYCPNCSVEISADARSCDKCTADFSIEGGWRPLEALLGTNPVPQARLRAAIGSNAERYLRAFERIEARGSRAPGWNMAAFLCSTGWFWYRRMWGLALASLLAWPVAFALGGVLLGAYALIFFALLPVFADALYYRHLKARLEKSAAATRPPSAWTAFGGLVVAVLCALLVAWAVMPQHPYAPSAELVKAIEAA